MSRCPPFPRQVQVGGLRLMPVHSISGFSTAPGKRFPPKPLVPVNTHEPELLPITFPIVNPAGGYQWKLLMYPMPETFTMWSRYFCEPVGASVMFTSEPVLIMVSGSMIAG